MNSSAALLPVESTMNLTVPKHIAIIMDGNGRWAEAKGKPRFMGHKSGVEAVRDIVKTCRKQEVKSLTLFAFSSENWRRPEQEVSILMELFLMTLRREVKRLHKNNVKLSIVGDLSRFNDKLQLEIEHAHSLTRNNDGLCLNIAANYGGQWDITQACRSLAHDVQRGSIEPESITPDDIAAKICLSEQEPIDLFIRTGGEKRISNFLLWQLAYAELYFCDTLWPDFREESLNDAIASFSQRQRRFGKTGAQIEQEKQEHHA